MHPADSIREHMEIVGSDGEHVGVVDHLEGQTVRLTRNDPMAGGIHHWIPIDWVAGVDRVIRLNRDSKQAVREWQAAAPGAPKA
jgi:hypothetical protein